ncbi:hypothetical protein P7K49_035888 [Saguinus oedipus]|uniref:Uncharacterized protein n=1 Tax=Saguinus oedipus TaxID=9490 RepID=A0ABQ9TNY5_SAGOE|nr:hypothetical protein P7K49_035888 [Saguinus oedipus]
MRRLLRARNQVPAGCSGAAYPSPPCAPWRTLARALAFPPAWDVGVAVGREGPALNNAEGAGRDHMASTRGGAPRPARPPASLDPIRGILYSQHLAAGSDRAGGRAGRAQALAGPGSLA